MAGRPGAASYAIVGSALAGLSLGIDWYRDPAWSIPGRMLDARLFIVAAVILGVTGAVRPSHARLATTGAAASILVAFALAVRQMSLSLVSPTALVVVAATVAAFGLARGAARRAAPASSHGSR